MALSAGASFLLLLTGITWIKKRKSVNGISVRFFCFCFWCFLVIWKHDVKNCHSFPAVSYQSPRRCPISTPSPGTPHAPGHWSFWREALLPPVPCPLEAGIPHGWALRSVGHLLTRAGAGPGFEPRALALSHNPAQSLDRDPHPKPEAPQRGGLWRSPKGFRQTKLLPVL